MKRKLSILAVILLVLGLAMPVLAGQMTAYPKFQAFDSDGVPLSGGKLHTYAPGTTTNKATYSDRGLTTANANPVVLDSRGEANVYFAGSIKFVLKTSADVTIWTVDNISGVGLDDFTLLSDYNSLAHAVTTIGATETTLYIDQDDTMSASVTVPSTLHLHFLKGNTITTTGYTLALNGPITAGLFQVFSGSGSVVFGDGYTGKFYPQWWGAVGDGVTDDTTAIQAAITAALVSRGGTVHFTVATWLHGDLTVAFTIKPITLEGDGFNDQTGKGTILEYTGTGIGITIEGNGSSYTGHRIKDMALRASSDNAENNWAIKWNKCAHIGMSNVYIRGFGNTSGGGLWFTGINSAPTYDQTEWVTLEKVFIQLCYMGVLVDVADSNDYTFDRCFFLNCTYGVRGIDGGAYTPAFSLQNWQFTGCRFLWASANAAILLDGGVRTMNIESNYFENNTSETACFRINTSGLFVKSTAVNFKSNAINVVPADGGGVVEVAEIDGLIVTGNTVTRAITGDRSMVRFLNSAIANCHIDPPRLPTGASMPYALKTVAGSTQINWTPTLSFGGGSTGITYGSQQGIYTRIGNMVVVQCRIVLTSKGTDTGNAAVGGLPFTVHNNDISSSAGGAFSYYDILVGLTGTPVCFAYKNTTTILLYQTGATKTTALTNAHFSDTSVIQFTCIYFTD